MYKIYQVEYGDTIEKIANKVNSTKDNIKNINGLSSDSDLVVGNLIVVPNNDGQMFEKYIVKQGDSIYSISRRFDVDPETLILLNGLNKDDYIYPNQEIMIPSRDLYIYVTRSGDTLRSLTNVLGVDSNTLNKENDRIFVMEDQLIIHKKGINN